MPVSLREELIHAKETVEDRWSVRAITSGILWVSSAGELIGCARPNRFGVYSDVLALKPWVQNTINQNPTP